MLLRIKSSTLLLFSIPSILVLPIIADQIVKIEGTRQISIPGMMVTVIAAGIFPFVIITTIVMCLALLIIILAFSSAALGSCIHAFHKWYHKK